MSITPTKKQAPVKAAQKLPAKAPAKSSQKAAAAGLVKKKRGRPTGATSVEPEDRQRRINITIDQTHHQIAMRAGEGNISHGIRVALSQWDAGKKTPRPTF